VVKVRKGSAIPSFFLVPYGVYVDTFRFVLAYVIEIVQNFWSG